MQDTNKRWLLWLGIGILAFALTRGVFYQTDVQQTDDAVAALTDNAVDLDTDGDYVPSHSTHDADAADQRGDHDRHRRGGLLRMIFGMLRLIIMVLLIMVLLKKLMRGRRRGRGRHRHHDGPPPRGRRRRRRDHHPRWTNDEAEMEIDVEIEIDESAPPEKSPEDLDE